MEKNKIMGMKLLGDIRLYMYEDYYKQHMWRKVAGQDVQKPKNGAYYTPKEAIKLLKDLIKQIEGKKEEEKNESKS